MSIPDALLPTGWVWAAHFVLIGVLAWALRSAPLGRLRSEVQLHVWLGTCVTLSVLWNFQPIPLRGMELHLLGATVFTLMFGARLAVIGLALVLAVTFGMRDLPWTVYSSSVLLLAAIPVGVSHGLLRLVERTLPRNPFVYFFVIAFAGAGLSMAVSALATTGLIVSFGAPAVALAAEQFLPYWLLLAFAEATLTGMVITIFVVYRPHWVGTFDDARYLYRR
jgi:uncharacterized membrane protein